MPDVPDRPEEELPPQVSTRDVIDEALRKKAEKSGPKNPVILPHPAPIPRQPKPARERKKRRRP